MTDETVYCAIKSCRNRAVDHGRCERHQLKLHKSADAAALDTNAAKDRLIGVKTIKLKRLLP